MPYRTIPERRIAKLKSTSVSVEGDCWIWTKATTWNGYGLSALNGKKTTAHRVMYGLHNGPIPDGLELDHLCRNRLCVNPEHLEPVTHSINLRRGLEATGCKRGHPYSPENFSLINRANGKFERRCKACHRERNRNAKSRHRKLEQLSGARG